jgi:hypothetical protein
VTQDGAGELGEEAHDEVRAVLGREGELEAAGRLSGMESSGTIRVSGKKLASFLLRSTVGSPKGLIRGI